jgi:hypothetical protein
MPGTAPAVFIALEQSGFSAAIRQSLWAYPLANIGHIVFLFVFAGAVVITDVCLLGGFATTDPRPVLARARTFAAVALLGMSITGFALFAAEAGHLAANPVFQVKIVLIAAGLLNAAFYEFWLRRRINRLSNDAAMPATAKITGLCSLGIWISVAACGRSIAYF